MEKARHLIAYTVAGAGVAYVIAIGVVLWVMLAVLVMAAAAFDGEWEDRPWS